MSNARSTFGQPIPARVEQQHLKYFYAPSLCFAFYSAAIYPQDIDNEYSNHIADRKSVAKSMSHTHSIAWYEITCVTLRSDRPAAGYVSQADDAQQLMILPIRRLRIYYSAMVSE